MTREREILSPCQSHLIALLGHEPSKKKELVADGRPSPGLKTEEKEET